RIIISLMIVLFLFGCKQTPETQTEIEPTPENGTSPGTEMPTETVYLTVGGSKDLKAMLGVGMSGKTITWSSSDSTKVAVSAGGIVTSNITSFTTAEGGSKKYTEGSAKTEVTIMAKASDNTTKLFKVFATTEA
ncbi:hypothetical protein, partial [Treponema sp. R6D11]